MTNYEIMNLLGPAMDAARKAGVELWAVLVDPREEGTYTCWQPANPETPILSNSILTEIAALYRMKKG